MKVSIKDRPQAVLKIPKSVASRHASRRAVFNHWTLRAALLVIQILVSISANGIQSRPEADPIPRERGSDVSASYQNEEPTAAARRAAAKGIVIFGILRKDYQGVPIGLRAGGSGLCIDNPCTEFYTDYHVAQYLVALKQPIVVLGTSALATVKWLGTGPDDENAVDMADALGVSSAKGNYDHDIAVMRLDAPLQLPKEFTGIRFGADPQLSQQTWITTSPTSSLVKVEVLSTHQGFGKVPHDLFTITARCRPGHSGLPVFDEDGLVIGLVSSIGEMADGLHVTLAIPVSNIEQVTRKYDLQLAVKLFGARSMAAAAKEQ
jgi:hypothetical protein